jgi:hypothetical protein
MIKLQQAPLSRQSAAARESARAADGMKYS